MIVTEGLRIKIDNILNINISILNRVELY